MERALVTLAVVLALGSSGAGCGPRAVGPEQAVTDWVSALEREDPAAAEALLAQPARAAADPVELAQRVRAVDPQALRETARRTGEARVVAVEARWPFGDDTLVVARSEDRWVLRHGVLGLYPCGTPEAALRSFLSAWRRERWDVVHELGPAEARARLTPAAVAARLQEPPVREALTLRAAALDELLAAGAPLPLGADPAGSAAATLSYGPYRARLTREDGCWRVADL